MQQNAEIGSNLSTDGNKNTYLESLQYADDLIDSAYSESSTSGEMKEMLWQAYETWDFELNKIYGLLKEKLPPHEMDVVRNEQRAWIKKRDKHTNPEEVGYLTQVEVLNDYTRERTLYLIDLYYE